MAFSEFIITKRLPKPHVSIRWLFTATLEKELLDAYFTNWHARSKLKVLMCLCYMLYLLIQLNLFSHFLLDLCLNERSKAQTQTWVL